MQAFELSDSILEEIAHLPVHTRIVPAHLAISLVKIDEHNRALCEQDFMQLLQNDADIAKKFIQSALTHHRRDDDASPILLELFSGLYRKLSHIEARIVGIEARLDGKNIEEKVGAFTMERSYSEALGHSIIILDKNHSDLIADSDYYGKLELLSFPEREVGVFLKALSKRALSITRIDPSDLQDLDTFIASRELELIRIKKALQEDNA